MATAAVSVPQAEVPDEPRLSAAYKKTRPAGLFSFAIGQVSDSAEGGLINTLFPVIQQALSLPLDALGQLSSVSKFARMLFGTLWSVVADRLGRKLVLVFMTGIWGLWTAAAGLAQDYTQLFILYAIGTIGTVAAEPITNGILVDMYEDDERGKAYGLLRSVSVLAGLFITPLIGQLSNVPDGWRYGMFIMGGISLLTGILIAIFVKEPPRRVTEGNPDAGKIKMADVGTIFKIPTVWLIAVSLLFITSMVLFAFMVTYFVKARGWTVAEGAVLYTVFMAGFGISGYFGGTLGDMFEKKFGPKGRVMFMQIYLVAFAVTTFLMTQIDWGHSFIFYVIASCAACGLALARLLRVCPADGRIDPGAKVRGHGLRRAVLLHPGLDHGGLPALARASFHGAGRHAAGPVLDGGRAVRAQRGLVVHVLPVLSQGRGQEKGQDGRPESLMPALAAEPAAQAEV
jgi:MFS family permease